MLKKPIVVLLLCWVAIPALAWTTLTVRPGQTVSGIVTKYIPSGVSGRDMLTALQNANSRLAKYGLQTGMTLKVPTTVADVQDALGGNSSAVGSQARAVAAPVPSRSNNNAVNVASVNKQLADCQATITNLQQALNNQTQNVQICQAKLGDLSQNTDSAAIGVIKKSSGILSFADLWFLLWLITFVLLWRVHLKYRQALQQTDHHFVPVSVASAPAKHEPAIVVKHEPQVGQTPSSTGVEPELHHVDEMDLRQVELDIPAADAPAQTQIPFTPSYNYTEERQEWVGEQKNIIDAIANDHDNIDWHMALLEFYIKTRNEGAYQRHLETMTRTGLMAEGDPLWEKVRKMYLNAWIYNEGAH